MGLQTEQLLLPAETPKSGKTADIGSDVSSPSEQFSSNLPPGQSPLPVEKPNMGETSDVSSGVLSSSVPLSSN